MSSPLNTQPGNEALSTDVDEVSGKLENVGLEDGMGTGDDEDSHHGGSETHARDKILAAVRSTIKNKQSHEEVTDYLLEILEISQKDPQFKITEFAGRVVFACSLSPPKMKSDITATQIHEAAVALQTMLAEEEMSKDDRHVLASPMFMIGETRRTNYIDVTRLHHRVNELFHWRTNPSAYMAPYFPIIQSSGMGKTKLMADYRNLALNNFKRVNVDEKMSVFIISCLPESKVGSTDVAKYDYFLNLKAYSGDDNEEERRTNFVGQLNGVLQMSQSKRVLLFFDEAHNLEGQSGFFLNCLRHFLTRASFLNSTTGIEIENVVAVLAGTSQSLAKLYPENAIGTTFSRDPNVAVLRNVGTELFPPYIDLWTIGSLRGRITYIPHASEYDRSIEHGRPLFARLLAPGVHDSSSSVTKMQAPLSDEKHYSILERMLLSKTNNWRNDLKACLSLLSTRVQLGNTHSSVVSDLVSKGYANLVYFNKPERGSGGVVSRFCHMTDPVCARLAMCMMIEGHKVIGEGGKSFTGKSPTFWSNKLSQLISGGLYSPPRGDLGEISFVLYMLFCGDKLRYQNDRSLTKFSVSMEELIYEMNGEPTTVTFDASVTVSFIQATRNELRVPYDKNYIAEQGRLKRLYESGRLTYSHEGCSVIDGYGSAKVGALVPSFVPLLISIKCQAEFAASSQGTALLGMLNILDGDTPGICILALLDLNSSVQLFEAMPVGARVEEAREILSQAQRELKDAKLELENAQRDAGDDQEDTNSKVEEEAKKKVEKAKKKVEKAKKKTKRADDNLKKAPKFALVDAALSAKLADAGSRPVARIVRVPATKYGITPLLNASTRVGSELAEVYSSHDDICSDQPTNPLRGSMLRSVSLPASSSESSPPDDVEKVLELFIQGSKQKHEGVDQH